MKFSIRDLQLVTLIAAILVAWYLDHRHKSVELQRLEKKLKDSEWVLPRDSVRDGFQLDVF
ncbi:MAG: hypothetical protein ACKVP0_18710 [Pirellulaceae bacterium]